jgi:hypothetical protein
MITIVKVGYSIYEGKLYHKNNQGTVRNDKAPWLFTKSIF